MTVKIFPIYKDGGDYTAEFPMSQHHKCSGCGRMSSPSVAVHTTRRFSGRLLCGSDGEGKVHRSSRALNFRLWLLPVRPDEPPVIRHSRRARWSTPLPTPPTNTGTRLITSRPKKIPHNFALRTSLAHIRARLTFRTCRLRGDNARLVGEASERVLAILCPFDCMSVSSRGFISG